MIRIIDHEGNGYGAQAEITRKKGVNGEKSLTGVIYTNDEVLNGVDRGWKLEFENEMYAFTFALPKDTGNRIELDFDAVHEFFYDMSKSAQNNLLNDGSHTFRAYLDFIFGNTPYNYSLDVNVQAFEKQTFGQRNRLDLFYDVINTAGVEFSVNGSVVRIVDRVGNDLSTVVKKGFNLNELRLEKNIGDFVTYQKGFGAWNDEEDHSKGRLEVEYLSPLAEIYGKLDADPIVDERYIVSSNLLARLQDNVEGSYQISVQIDMEDLTRAGYDYKQPHEGDSIMAINEDLGFQRKVRIVSYETDFDIEGNILDHRITCNSVGMVEQSISSANSIRYAINELQNDLELARQQITESRVSADGKSMNYFGPIEPTVDDYKLSIGDTWFDTSGEDTVMKVWNGVEWRNAGVDVEALERQFREFEQDIAEAQATADDTAQQIDTAVSSLGFVDLPSALSSFDGQLVTHQETLDGMQSIIYDPDRGIASLNTQLADLVQVAVTGEEMTGAISVLENNINARVEKGDVINQINISDESILIQANKIMALGDVVVDGKLTITDEFIAPNAQIDGAKIGDLTVSSSKIASLDVNKVSGLDAEFIRTNWNSNVGNVLATGDGLELTRNDGSLQSRLGANGMEFWINGNRHGELSIRKYNDTLSVLQGRQSIGFFARQNAYISFASQGTSGSGHNDIGSGQGYISMAIMGDTGNIQVFEDLNIHKRIHMQSNNIDFIGNLNFTGGGGSTIYSGANYMMIETINNPIRLSVYNTRRMEISSMIDAYAPMRMNGNTLSIATADFGNSAQIRASSSYMFIEAGNSPIRFTVYGTRRAELSSVWNMYANITMNSNNINGVGELNYSSDARFKDVLGERTADDLATIMAIDYKDYMRDGKKQRGIIAQELQLIDSELISVDADGYLNYDGQGYMHTIGHAVQQLGHKHESIAELAESNESKIHQLQTELSKANRRIEELERKIA